MVKYSLRMSLVHIKACCTIQRMGMKFACSCGGATSARDLCSLLGRHAGTFDFDLEEQELDEVTVRQRVLEEMNYYSSSRLALKTSSGAQSQASSQTAETLSA